MKSAGDKKWWQTRPWREMSRGQKIGTVTSWLFLSLMLMALFYDGGTEQPSPTQKAAKVEESAPQVQPSTQETIKRDSPSAKDVSAFIAELDSAVKASESALRRGDLKSLHEHSKWINQLRSNSDWFGSSVFDSPYGRCFGAGISAQNWWSAQLSAAQRGGAEATPGWISDAWKEFQENRSKCLKAAKIGGKSADTEQIAFVSETPPRQGCLKILGVRPDGQVGTVAYTCPKK